jgi:hypothetical protein
MSLESVSFIGDLVPTNPTAADPKSEGDDHIRRLKTALLNSLTGLACASTDGGIVNAYTITPVNALPSYGLRMLVVFSPTMTNTGASTLNISGLGAKALTSVDGSALVSGDLVAGSIYSAFYDGTQFRLNSVTKNYTDQLAFGTALPAQAGNNGKFITTNGTSASWGLPAGSTLYLNTNYGGF